MKLDIKKYRGCLLGLAVGDALGAPIEMKEPGTFKKVGGLDGGGYFKLKPGEWTDDTALMLCSAQSLINKRKFDPRDHLRSFLRWYREGYMSTRNKAFGVGLVTASALLRFESTSESFCGPTGVRAAHNGSLMHIAPIPLAYAMNPARAIVRATDASRLTHGAREAIDACRYITILIIGALQGWQKAEMMKPRFQCGIPNLWCKVPLVAKIDIVAMRAFKKQFPKITRDNYSDATITLHSALWAFHTTNTFKEGLLRVVNLGWDADTAGAVYGQLAGAYYGEDAIPGKWRSKIFKRARIVSLANQLYELAEERPA